MRSIKFKAIVDLYSHKYRISLKNENEKYTKDKLRIQNELLFLQKTRYPEAIDVSYLLKT